MARIHFISNTAHPSNSNFTSTKHVSVVESLMSLGKVICDNDNVFYCNTIDLEWSIPALVYILQSRAHADGLI